MRKIALVFLLVATLFPLQSVSCPQTQGDVARFIVFSDTHVGAGRQADGLNGSERLSKLLCHAGQFMPLPMICLGDLTNGWYLNNTKQRGWYQEYLRLTKPYRSWMEEVKGNHDCNRSLWRELMGKENWVYRWNDMLFVGVSSLNEDGVNWWTRGASYNKTTYDFLACVIKSANYTQTKHHFLFMHFAPNSTFDAKGNYGVSARFSAYLRYFSVAFHGHEGSKSKAYSWFNTVIVEASHLDGGKYNSYVLVQLNRASGAVTADAYNFLLGNCSRILG